MLPRHRNVSDIQLRSEERFGPLARCSQKRSLPRKVATAHTLFNAINLLLFIGFTTHFARLATKLVPERVKAVAATQPIYLYALFLDTPSMAIDRARMETARMATYAINMAEEIPRAAIESPQACHSVSKPRQ